MSNEIEIRVTSRDLTGTGFKSVDDKVRGLEKSTGATMDRTARKFKESGEAAGKGFTDSTARELEKGLVANEAKLKASLARMEKAVALGAGGNAKRSIQYDIKINEASVAKSKEEIRRHAESIARDGVWGRAGKLAGSTLASGIGEATGGGLKSFASSPVVGTIAAGLGIVVVGALAPVIVTGIGSAIALGLGGGVIAAGIMAALNNPKVDAALTTLKTKAVKAFESFGKSFEAPMMRAFGTFTSGLDRLSPAFGRISNMFAPLIDKLAPALMQMAENAMPGLERGLKGIEPVIETLADNLPMMGDALGEFFSSIGEGGPGFVAFLSDAMTYTADFIVFLGDLFEVGSKAFKWMEDLRPDWVTNILGLGDAADDSADGLEHMAQAGTGMEKAAQDAGDAIAELTTKMINTGLLTLSARDAERNFQAALDGVTSSAKKNGLTLDNNTDKGRENAQALDGIAKAAHHVTDGLMRSGASQDVLSRSMQRGADASFNAARKMGMSTSAAIAYTRSVYGIPPSRDTLVKLLGAAKSKQEARDIQNAINSIHNKQVYIDVITRGKTAGSANAAEYRAHGGIKGAADGGMKSGRTWVGEQGPELVDLPPGARVHPAGQSQRMAAGGGAAKVELVVSARTSSERELVAFILKLLRLEIRNEGGDVQAVLGRA